MASIVNTFNVAMTLTEDAWWKVATIKEANRVKDLGVYTLLPQSTIHPGKKNVWWNSHVAEFTAWSADYRAS